MAAAGAALDTAMTESSLSGGARYLMIIDAVSGYGMETEATQLMESLNGDFAVMSAGRLWLLGLWAWRRGD